MPEEGVEPSRPEGHGILSPARLPVSPLRRGGKRSVYNRGATRWISQSPDAWSSEARLGDGVIADSRSPLTSTTGPLNSTATGIRSFHTAPFGYTAARSQSTPDRSQHSSSGCGRATIGGQRLRDDMVGIPILLRPPIGDAIQRERRRVRPVGRQDGFPHDEDARGGVAMTPQNRGDCGRPPQARRSRRREQEDDPNIAGRTVEVGSQPLD